MNEHNDKKPTRTTAESVNDLVETVILVEVVRKKCTVLFITLLAATWRKLDEAVFVFGAGRYPSPNQVPQAGMLTPLSIDLPLTAIPSPLLILSASTDRSNDDSPSPPPKKRAKQVSFDSPGSLIESVNDSFGTVGET